MTALVDMLWLLLIAQLLSFSSSELYHIVPVSDTASCHDYPELTNCFTLERFQYQFKYGIISGNNTIIFMNGNHTLTWGMYFKGTGDVTLKNSEHVGTNSSPVITCDANADIDVYIRGNFTIQGLVFTAEEGVVHQYELLNVHNAAHTTLTQSSFVKIHSNKAVVSISTSKLKISNCRFINNSGQMVLEIENTYSCNIERSEFRGNKGLERGGAIYAYIHNVIQITESIFVNNSASSSGSAIYMYLLGSFHSIKNRFEANSCNYMGEGAVYVLMYSNRTSKFQGDLFQNNIARFGAALFITGDSDTITCYSISNCTFSNNTATHPDYPSVVHNDKLKLILTGPVTFEDNFGSLYATESDVNVNGNLVFRNNTGVNGGGITLKNSNLKLGDNDISTKVNITDNKASYGAGVYLEQSSIKSVRQILTIANNAAKIAGGGIYAFESQISITFPKYASMIHVVSNLAKVGGGIYMSGSNLRLSLIYFRVINNTAYQYGGGACLERDSRIIVINEHINSGILLEFTGNSAVKGGGIFVADSINSKLTCDRIASLSQTEIITTQCFIQNEKLFKSKLIFNNNSATEAGSDIYGGLLDRCTMSTRYGNSGYGLQYLQANEGFGWAENKRISEYNFPLGLMDSHHILVIYGHVTDKTEFHNHISSDPMRVCFCVNGTVDCDYTHPTVFTEKGHQFTLSLAAVDQVEKPVNATLISSLLFENQGEGRLNQGQQSTKLPQQCTELKYNAFSSTSQAVLELYAEGPCGKKGISRQLVNITFEPCDCPIGLERYPPYIDCVCDCNKELKESIKISNCSKLNGTIQLNKNMWIKYINDTNNTEQFVTDLCPFDYCKKKPLVFSLVNKTETNEQCAFNRIGTLCGKCAQGLSMVLASSQCQICSNYYLFLLLPFGLAGIALVAFILLLNITVATGTIHGLIFYANIIIANRSVFLPFGKPNVLTVFLSWLNLDLGIETCFYYGMDSYGKLMLQLVFPAYVIFLIATIMVLCDRSQTIARLFGKRNPEATLYTLFLLSYSKLIRTIVTALQFATLDYPDGSQEIAWLYDANVRYFAINHIPRFLTAFIITILGAVYTSLLLFGQLFNRCSDYPLMKWTSHKYYIHFMKAHHAPLSDKHRYWVGLLLLARLTHYLISSFANDFTIVLFASIMTLLLLVHKLVVKPYAKMLVNFMDVFFLVNLSVLAVGTFYVQVSGGNQQALAIVSMSISFIAFLGIMFYHILDNYGVKTKILSKLKKRSDIDYRPLAIIETEDENTSDESDEELIDLSNAPEDTATIEPYDLSRYITPPIIRSVLPDDQLREPALDDICPLTPANYNFQPATPRIRQIRQAPTVLLKNNKLPLLNKL